MCFCGKIPYRCYLNTPRGGLPGRFSERLPSSEVRPSGPSIRIALAPGSGDSSTLFDRTTKADEFSAYRRLSRSRRRTARQLGARRRGGPLVGPTRDACTRMAAMGSKQPSGPSGRGRACPQRQGKEEAAGLRRLWAPFVLAKKFPISSHHSLPYPISSLTYYILFGSLYTCTRISFKLFRRTVPTTLLRFG